MATKIYSSPIGRLEIVCEEGAVKSVSLIGNSSAASTAGNSSAVDEALATQTQRQLEEYFLGKRKRFELPLKPEGSPFQLRAWQELENIPYGETVSYKQLAELCGSPKAFRAAGGACHNNPIIIIIPCHRVLASNGSLCGYACGLDVKKHLLDIERGGMIK